MILLSIETATDVCSVALHNESGLIDYYELQEGMTHSQNLSVIIDRLMQANALKFTSLKAVAVSQGPGSYTGLRIGVSLAKGICFAHKLPLISIDTLKIMAAEASSLIKDDLILCPMIDARRMEVYHALYNSYLDELKPATPLIVEKESFKGLLENDNLVLFGNGMDKCRELFKDNPCIKFLDGIKPSAKHVGYIGIEKYKKKEFEDLAYFEPFYLKNFVAKPGKKLI